MSHIRLSFVTNNPTMTQLDRIEVNQDGKRIADGVSSDLGIAVAVRAMATIVVACSAYAPA